MRGEVMGELVPRVDNLPTTFEPEDAGLRDAMVDGAITAAKRVQDWPALEIAVDKKMEDQTEFVRWWDETVGVRQHSHSEVNAAQRSPISREAAENATQIKQQQVSKWRNRLKDPEKYRALLFGVAYNKAMAETNNTTATKWTGDPESYTPAQYIEAARDLMGAIDLVS